MTLPAPEAWNDAVAHSLACPTHILGPYEDARGMMQMCCDGDGDPYEPSNCDFTTEPADVREVVAWPLDLRAFPGGTGRLRH